MTRQILDDLFVFGHALSLKIQILSSRNQYICWLGFWISLQELLLEAASDIAHEHFIELIPLEPDLLDVLDLGRMDDHVLHREALLLLVVKRQVQSDVEFE